MSDPNRTQALTDPNKTQLGVTPSVDPNKTMMGTAPSLNATMTIQPVQCPVCKTFNPSGVMFCIECGLIFDRALPDDAFGAPTVRLPVLVDSSGKEHPLRPGANSIGREGDVMLVDGRVSRRHAQVSLRDGALAIEDLGSTNGTMVDGARLGTGESKALVGGETLSFGGVEVRLSMPGEGIGGRTQTFPSNRTAAIAAPPTVSQVAGQLVGGEASYPLKLGANTFGRKSDNDIVISDAYVSGKHGVIELEENETYLTDVGSTNGTQLNDAKLGANLRTRITSDDIIKLGTLEFRVTRSS